MASPNFESGFIATIVLLAVAVAVIATLAGVGSYGPPKSAKPKPEPSPPATLASLAKRVRAVFKPRLAGAKLKSSSEYDACLAVCEVWNGRYPFKPENCAENCAAKKPYALTNLSKKCIRVLVAADSSMTNAQVFDLGSRQDGSIMECGSGALRAEDAVGATSWLVVEQRYLGSSYDITYPFQVPADGGILRPPMEVGNQQIVGVDRRSSTITVGL